MPRSLSPISVVASRTPSAMGLRLWGALILLRVINAVFLKTYFDPDEYWQVAEVAHHRVFGYGWLTWEWRSGLRSWLYLLPLIAWFEMIKFFGLDKNADYLIIYGPKVLQAVSAATVDYLTYVLALRLFKSRKTAEATLFMSVINWFNMAYSVRTISNNFEVLLVLLAALCWPIDPSNSFSVYRLAFGFSFIGLSVLNRPSAVTHWIVPTIIAFISIPGFRGKGRFITLFLSISLLVLLLGIGMDSLFYGRLTLTWWNFFKYNVLERISDFYGVNSWHFHVTMSIPAMIGTMLPFAALSIISDQYSTWILQFLIGSLALNSLLPHKEIRFVYPNLPFVLMLAGHGYRVFSSVLGTSGIRWLRRMLLLFVLLSNLMVGVYFTHYHQSGVIRVVDYLREEYDSGRTVNAYFAMPCHSTPFFGYLHRPAKMDFIKCEPPMKDMEQKDESALFYKDPAKYLYTNLPSDVSQLVIFESLLAFDGMDRFLMDRHYSECFRIFNSHFNGDSRRKGDVLVLCKA